MYLCYSWWAAQSWWAGVECEASRGQDPNEPNIWTRHIHMCKFQTPRELWALSTFSSLSGSCSLLGLYLLYFSNYFRNYTFLMNLHLTLLHYLRLCFQWIREGVLNIMVRVSIVDKLKWSWRSSLTSCSTDSDSKGLPLHSLPLLWESVPWKPFSEFCETFWGA